MRARRLSVAAVSAALLLVPTACSSGGEEDPAVSAVCDDFSYDDQADLGANEDRLRSIIEDAGGDPASLGQVLSAAEEECADTVEPYFAAAEKADASGGEASEPPAAEDLEDEDLAAALEARGIDPGAVARLAGAAQLLGVGASEDAPLSPGAAQRFAAETADRCDAVASGSSTWEAETADIAADTGASEAKARQLVVYLQNHFCANLV